MRRAFPAILLFLLALHGCPGTEDETPAEALDSTEHTVFESASQARPSSASTVTLCTPRGERPVDGSIRWWKRSPAALK